MALAVTLMAVLLPVAMATAFLLGRHFHRRQATRAELSPVIRQHIDLFQGGQLNEVAIESAKNRFREMLDQGQIEAVEASMRPGMQYVIQVRALAEIGTDDAGRILERQLQRHLSDDAIEQSWYWIDLAHGLRSLNREQSLPHLLRCAESAEELPLGHFFAAETVCFLGFSGYLDQANSTLGRAALRVLHRSLEGLRHGVQPQMVIEARLGEMIEKLWDQRPDTIQPLMVRVFSEALRLLRRAPHAEIALADERAEQEAFTWQMSRLAALEPAMQDYLQEAPFALCRTLADAGEGEQRDILNTLHDLRCEAASAVLPLLTQPHYSNAELAVSVLHWSKDPRVGPFLREWAYRKVPMLRRAQARRASVSPRRRSLPPELPYRSILRTLRGHPSRETETFLMLAARDWDPAYRAAAVSSFGWWEPLERAEVLLCLQESRRDPSPEVRQMARAALARLGERQALQWFGQALTSEEPQCVHEAIQLVASESLTLLWPDLDRLCDAEDSDIAYLAREAIERLREELDFERR